MDLNSGPSRALNQPLRPSQDPLKSNSLPTNLSARACKKRDVKLENPE